MSMIINPYAFAGEFIPSNDTDLISWWDTTDGSTITESGDKVSSWAPKAGSSSLVLPQATESEKPITNSRTINSLNVFDCDGTQYLRSAATFPVPTSGNMTVMGVFAIDSVSGIFDPLFSMQGTVDWQLQSQNASQFNGTVDMASGGAGTDSALFTNRPFSGNHIFHIVFDFDNTEYIAYVDNVAEISATLYDTKFSVTQILNIFRTRGDGASPNGAIGDIIITESIDQSGIITDHYDYLADKYAI